MKKRTLKLLFALIVSATTLLICTVSSSAALAGDVADGDNLVTANDARTILRAAVGLEALTDEQKDIADINYDGAITAADARAALRISVSLDPALHFYQKEILTAPDCTQPGTMKLTCTECDDIQEVELEALGHDFAEPEIIAEVTCETDGTEKYTCQRENCGHSEEKTVPAGHVPDIEAATCTQAQLCTRGNHVITDKLGHTTDWGACDRCKVYITEKYAAEAETIKTKFNEAKTAFEAAYAINSYNAMIDGISWKVIPNTKTAKPEYIKAKTAYEAALAACGDIPEFSAIRKLLEKNITNINGVLSQVDVILATKYIDNRNFEELVWPLEELNDFNSDSVNGTNKKLSRLIVW